MIQVFRDVHLTFERNLALSHLTSRHADPDMTLTFSTLLKSLEKSKPHEIKPGRKSERQIPDMMDKGQCLLWATSSDEVEAESGSAEEDMAEVTLEDVTIEGGI